MLNASPYSAKVPVELPVSKSADFLVPLDGTPWLDDMAQDALDRRWPRLSARNIKVCVYTTVGSVTKARIEPGLQRKLVERHTKLHNG